MSCFTLLPTAIKENIVRVVSLSQEELVRDGQRLAGRASVSPALLPDVNGLSTSIVEYVEALERDLTVSDSLLGTDKGRVALSKFRHKTLE